MAHQINLLEDAALARRQFVKGKISTDIGGGFKTVCEESDIASHGRVAKHLIEGDDMGVCNRLAIQNQMPFMVPQACRVTFPSAAKSTKDTSA